MIETTDSQAREQLKMLMDRAVDDREVIMVRRRDGDAVAIIAADELESLMETAHLLRSPRNAERLLAALASAVGRMPAGRSAISTPCIMLGEVADRYRVPSYPAFLSFSPKNGAILETTRAWPLFLGIARRTPLDPPQTLRWYVIQFSENLWNQRVKVLDTVTHGFYYENRNWQRSEILLKLDILVHCQEDIEPRGSKRE